MKSLLLSILVLMTTSCEVQMQDEEKDQSTSSLDSTKIYEDLEEEIDYSSFEPIITKFYNIESITNGFSGTRFVINTFDKSSQGLSSSGGDIYYKNIKNDQDEDSQYCYSLIKEALENPMVGVVIHSSPDEDYIEQLDLSQYSKQSRVEDRTHEKIDFCERYTPEHEIFNIRSVQEQIFEEDTESFFLSATSIFGDPIEATLFSNNEDGGRNLEQKYCHNLINRSFRRRTDYIRIYSINGKMIKCDEVDRSGKPISPRVFEVRRKDFYVLELGGYYTSSLFRDYHSSVQRDIGIENWISLDHIGGLDSTFVNCARLIPTLNRDEVEDHYVRISYKYIYRSLKADSETLFKRGELLRCDLEIN